MSPLGCATFTIIVHLDLSPNHILLTAHHVAKISDLGVAKVVRADGRSTLTTAPETVNLCRQSVFPIIHIMALPWMCFHLEV